MIALSGLLIAGSCCREEKKNITATPRLIYNCDGTDLTGNYMFKKRPLSLADVHAYVDAYAQTPITTFMMCSGTNNLNYRSAYTRVFGEDPQGQDPGTYNITDIERCYRNFLNVEREGADVIEAVLQRANEHQLETFISYRMNDVHFNSLDASPLGYCDFWKDHPEYWIHEKIGWNTEGGFDFAYPEVRAFKADIIAEQLDKYGHLIDGFDLDFMRMPVYFKTSEGAKNAPLMTELIRTIKQKIDETSKRTGRNILLSVKVWLDVDICYQMGLDVKAWVKAGLVDMVTVGGCWQGHPAVPVAKFRSDLDNAAVLICAEIEVGGYVPRESFSLGQRCGMAAHAYAQGADGIYLFNHFLEDDNDNRVASPTNSHSIRSNSTLPLYYEIGSLEQLRRRNKIFALDDGGAKTYVWGSVTPLPLTVTAMRQPAVELYVADDVQNDRPQEAILFLRADRPASLSISVNQTQVDEQKPEYVELFDRGNKLQGTDTVYAYRVPVAALKQGNNQISIISSSGEVKIKRLEMAIKYGDVDECGYF